MLEFFSAVVEFFGMLGKVITIIINGPLFLISQTAQGLVTLTTVLGYMPAVLVAFASTGIIICIMYLIIGR